VLDLLYGEGILIPVRPIISVCKIDRHCAY
jgi:hypothetical protein